MKIKFLLLTFFVSAASTYAQVEKQIIVEHFTNSLCGVCTWKNPLFYSNLNAQENVLHLAIYPSAPYPDCLLNQNNVEENDARTNYYAIYGATPRLVIQGTVISAGSDYGSASIFTPFIGDSSPASIRIIQWKFDNDSIHCIFSIKTEAAHTLGELKLFAALAEDTVFYASPNGELLHFDVFRKSLFAPEGESVYLPFEINDSIIVEASALVNADWNTDRLYTIAILQENETKSVVQSSAHPVASDELPEISDTTTAIINNLPDIKFYPNPVEEGFLNIHCDQLIIYDLELFDLTGRLLFSAKINGAYQFDMRTFSAGQYLLKISNEGGQLNKLITRI